uniref:Uncharacterized protein n=1 Tax=Oryza sativa subsp. japonica TaxID=39947 RepID=Q651Y6_ORYSJ|nr:hypothetical protein [Oryza sativa Japonica Group]
MEGGWYTSHSPSSVGGLCRVGRVLQTYRLVFNRSATLVGYRCSTAAAAALWRRARGIPASRLAATHRARRRVGGGASRSFGPMHLPNLPLTTWLKSFRPVGAQPSDAGSGGGGDARGCVQTSGLHRG